jgi:CYTH domain-containing protein
MMGIYTVNKTRYSIVLHESTRPIEVDIYPGHEDYAILEIEVPSMDAPVTIPGYLTVIREVTGDERFDNAQIAANGCRLPDLGTLS